MEYAIYGSDFEYGRSSDVCPTPVRVSNKMKSKVSSCFGERGVEWLENLPFLLSSTLDHFNLSMEQQFNDLSLSYVARVRDKNDRRLVLKLCATQQEAERESNALSYLKGRGVVKIIAYSKKYAALLLEDVFPGGQLLASCASESTRITIAAKAMDGLSKSKNLSNNIAENLNGTLRKGSRKSVDSFDSMNILKTKLSNNLSRCPGNASFQELGAIAADIMEELCEPNANFRVIHGDLHHKNIIWSERYGWKVIDPKGLYGDPAYEAAAFMLHPMEPITLAQGMEKGCDYMTSKFSEVLQLDSKRIIGWCFCEAVIRGAFECNYQLEEAERYLLTANTLLKNI